MPDKTPFDIFGQLFVDMHLSGAWSDGKTIADLIPIKSPKEILKEYNSIKNKAGFQLKAFVDKNFIETEKPSSDFIADTRKTVQEHVESLWPVLTRKSDKAIPGSSLIPLSEKYVVPGGRFNEIYYWDSYFTMLGLKVSGRIDLIQNMVNNFSTLIQGLGHVPNGNRSYFLSRSQPPFFSCMVELLAECLDRPEVYTDYLDSMLREYSFWMDEKEKLHKDGDTERRVVKFKGFILNRYYDDDPRPRAEMYGEDYRLAQECKKNSQNLFLNIKAACESGWDFSSRWLDDELSLCSIQTTDLLPIDLNCLLFHLEKTLAKAYHILGKEVESESYRKLAHSRQRAIQYFYNDENGFYEDINFKTNSFSERITLAALFPLFFNIASASQADSVTKVVQDKLLADGGLLTSTLTSGQQWDAPNGWAPLQWIAVKGLLNYGHHELAQDVKNRWMNLNENIYRSTGKMLEKYNVSDVSLMSGGGEYPVQDGFGWTNGVYLALLNLV